MTHRDIILTSQSYTIPGAYGGFFSVPVIFAASKLTSKPRR